jgi:transcription antitermination factor NusG
MNPSSQANFSQIPSGFPLQNVVSDNHLRWYAVYTWARHEKVVARHFEERGVVYFLPLYQAIHRWNERSARVSLPLFPGYVFVQIGATDRHTPLQVPGVVHFVSTGGAPCPIPDEEVEALRIILLSGKNVGPHPYLSPGNSVQITSGPLAGLCGTIERTKSGSRFIVSVEMIKRSVAIELDGFQIAAMQPNSGSFYGRDFLELATRQEQL